MILCERCRTQIPNPDPSTFDDAALGIIRPDGTRVRLGPVAWRFLAHLMAHVGRAHSNEEMVRALGLNVVDANHSLAGYRWLLRKRLVGTPWAIETHYGKTRLVRL